MVSIVQVSQDSLTLGHFSQTFTLACRKLRLDDKEQSNEVVGKRKKNPTSVLTDLKPLIENILTFRRSISPVRIGRAFRATPAAVTSACQSA